MITRVLIYLLFCLSVCPLPLRAQQAVLSFEQQAHRFGKIVRQSGEAVHHFTFTNKGDKPLIIRQVEASCGCTTLKWSRKPVPPGTSGMITVTLDPRLISGRFTKVITVYSNAGNNPAIPLKVSGEVISGAAGIAQHFPTSIGSLRLDRDSFRWDYRQETQVIQLYNSGKKRLSITSIAKPDGLEVFNTPLSIPAGGQGNISLRRTTPPPRKQELILIRTSEGGEGRLLILY